MKLAIKGPDGKNRIIGTLAAGDAGIDQTAAAMLALIQRARRSRIVQEHAARLQAEADITDEDFFNRVYEWLANAQQRTPDPDGIEYVRCPEILLAEAANGGRFRGDCDDVACLGCALLAANKYRAVLITAGKEPRALGGRLVHVFYGWARGRGPLNAGNVMPFDPQEGYYDYWPDVSRLRFYEATGEHA